MTASAGPYIVALTTARLKCAGCRRWRASSITNHGTVSPIFTSLRPTEGAVDPDAQVGRERHERPGGDGVPGAGGDHGRRKPEDPLGERRSERQHLDHLIDVAAGEDLQVEARGEVALAAGQDDDRAVALGLIEGARGRPAASGSRTR